jgi:hypothetical protein
MRGNSMRNCDAERLRASLVPPCRRRQSLAQRQRQQQRPPQLRPRSSRRCNNGTTLVALSSRKTTHQVSCRCGMFLPRNKSVPIIEPTDVWKRALRSHSTSFKMRMYLLSMRRSVAACSTQYLVCEPGLIRLVYIQSLIISRINDTISTTPPPSKSKRSCVCEPSLSYIQLNSTD